MEEERDHFYERTKFSEFKSNSTYHQLLQLTDDEFDVWAKLLRKEIVGQWDLYDMPPVIGKNVDGIVKSFKKLRGNSCDFWEKDLSDDPTSLGIIKNFNKDGSPINQFFPTMLKTKVSSGATHDSGLSIYDYFGNDEMEKTFISIMKRAVRKDSMYIFSHSLIDKKDVNPFWTGQTGYDFLTDVHNGKVFIGEYSDYEISIVKMQRTSLANYGRLNDKFTGFKNIYLEASEITELIENGILPKSKLNGFNDVVEYKLLKNGKKTEYVYQVRWYERKLEVFPKLLQVIRLSCGQPVVNFPALTAKYLYERFTSHIVTDDPLIVYDSSAGWGGRIIGAMSSRKRIHYVGTDPNPDNFIPELGISRYEYVADFYNDNCIDDYSESLGKFFEVEKQSNTFEMFQDGSETIEQNPRFDKYKGNLDFSFTSPPYFNRERYGDEGTGQSWDNYTDYDNWRDNFLKPTLTTIYNNLKPDRYCAWNIADIKIGADKYYELEGDSIKIMEELGGEYRGKLKMLMSRMVGLDPTKSGIKNSLKRNGKGYKYEPILIFYKPMV